MSISSKLIQIASKKSPHGAQVLKTSEWAVKEVIATMTVPALNLAHSGRMYGEGAGMSFGSHQIVGESKTFKTLFGIIQVADYLKTFKDAICVFVDSEFGANLDYWNACGVDQERVVHLPVSSVEEMMNVVIPMLESLSPDDHVIFFTDSVGQLGSKKELENSMTGEAGKQDFTRAKSLNSFWRLAVPLINLSKTPFIWIGGVYDTTDQYNPVALSGGKKGELGSDSVWLITKSKQKESVKNEETGKTKEEHTGWIFNVKIHKSRFVREGSVVPVCVRYDGGVDPYFNVLEIARKVGAVDMPRSGYYCRTELLGFVDDKAIPKSQMTPEWYNSFLKNQDFNNLVADLYELKNENLLNPVNPNTPEV